jgi:hypothetical protein
VAERSKALDWNSSNTHKVFVGSNPTLSANKKDSLAFSFGPSGKRQAVLFVGGEGCVDEPARVRRGVRSTPKDAAAKRRRSRA